MRRLASPRSRVTGLLLGAMLIAAPMPVWADAAVTMDIPAEEALSFSGNGVGFDTRGVIGPLEGVLRMELEVGERWSEDERRAIMVLGSVESEGISLTVSDGRLYARYSSGESEPATVAYRLPRAGGWDTVGAGVCMEAAG